MSALGQKRTLRTSIGVAGAASAPRSPFIRCWAMLAASSVRSLLAGRSICRAHVPVRLGAWLLSDLYPDGGSSGGVFWPSGHGHLQEIVRFDRRRTRVNVRFRSRTVVDCRARCVLALRRRYPDFAGWTRLCPARLELPSQATCFPGRLGARVRHLARATATHVSVSEPSLRLPPTSLRELLYSC